MTPKIRNFMSSCDQFWENFRRIFIKKFKGIMMFYSDVALCNCNWRFTLQKLKEIVLKVMCLILKSLMIMTCDSTNYFLFIKTFSFCFCSSLIATLIFATFSIPDSTNIWALINRFLSTDPFELTRSAIILFPSLIICSALPIFFSSNRRVSSISDSFSEFDFFSVKFLSLPPLYS